jgi:dolichyl-phosphate-mannose--protein O-mannosyl transferase
MEGKDENTNQGWLDYFKMERGVYQWMAKALILFIVVIISALIILLLSVTGNFIMTFIYIIFLSFIIIIFLYFILAIKGIMKLLDKLCKMIRFNEIKDSEDINQIHNFIKELGTKDAIKVLFGREINIMSIIESKD